MKKKLVFTLGLLVQFCVFAQFGERQQIGDDFQTSRLVASDLDGDGDLDVLASGQNPDSVAWYENLDGQANFGAVHYISQTLNFTQSLASADFDGDGDMDVLATSAGDDKVVWYKNMDGQGDFGPEIIINDNAPNAKQAVATDLDNDGDMDVVVALRDAAKIVWYKNLDGGGTFSEELLIVSNMPSVTLIDVVDINGDGYKDVLANTSSIGFPSWHEHIDGQGTFGTEHIISNFGSLVVRAADVDGDGDQDVFSVEFIDDVGTLSLYENIDGLGTFSLKQNISNIFLPSDALFPVDVDNDGDLDLLSAFLGEGKIVWYENTDGLGTYSERIIIDDFATRTIVGADLDGDGDQDVLTKAGEDSRPSWYENLTILGVNEFSNESITIYPNPVSNIVTINNTSTIQIETIKIYDVLGRRIFQEDGNLNTIDVSYLKSGLLFIMIETAEGVLTKKVLKD